MINNKWLSIAKDIAAEIQDEIPKIVISRCAEQIVNPKGASGDETLLVDSMAEGIYLKHLDKAYKKGFRFSVLSEEIGFVDFGAQFPIVVIDPIDGSHNAKKNLPFYSTVMSVFSSSTLDSIEVGYVRNLVNGDEFYAKKDGIGFYFNDRRINYKPQKNLDKDKLKHKVQKSKIIETFCIESSDLSNISKLSSILPYVSKMRLFGSLALDICYVAVGKADILWHLGASRVLDFAASKLVLEKAGGIVTDEEGKRLDKLTVDLERKTGLVAALDLKLHKKLINLLHID